MRKLSFIVLGGLISLYGSLQADDDAFVDNQNISAEKMKDSSGEEDGIFQISVKADWVGEAKIDKRCFPHNHVKFREGGIQGTAVVYYNCECKEGLAVGVGTDYVYFNWDKNFYFDQTKFNEVSFAISAFSERVNDWLWQAQLSINCDTRHWSFSYYTNYDFFLWGRYEFCSNFHLHGGFYAQTGLKIDRIFPVLGFDWTINDQWKLNAIYPFNMSLVYSYCENWTAALAVRLFNVRYRVSKHEPLPKGLFQYRNAGLELAFNYEKNKLSGNVHAGCTLGGEFTISNKNNKNKRHFDLDAAPYIGGELSMKF